MKAESVEAAARHRRPRSSVPQVALCWGRTVEGGDPERRARDRDQITIEQTSAGAPPLPAGFPPSGRCSRSRRTAPRSPCR